MAEGIPAHSRGAGAGTLRVGRPFPIGTDWRGWARALALPVVACLLIAVAIAFLRPATYTAQSRILISKTDVRVAAIPGQVEAGKILSARYSALVESTVAEDVARKLGAPVTEIRQRLRGEAVPERPIFAIEATGRDEAAAVRLADVATTSALATIAERNRTDREAERLLKRYRAASVTEARLRVTISRLVGQRDTAATAARYRTLDRRVKALRVDAATAGLQASTLGSVYRQTRQADESTGPFEAIDRPREARSDRWAWLRALVLAGLVAGLAIGTAARLGASSWLPDRRAAVRRRPASVRSS